jgi:hypothetical protein
MTKATTVAAYSPASLPSRRPGDCERDSADPVDVVVAQCGQSQPKVPAVSSA